MIQKRKELEVMRANNANINKIAKDSGFGKDWALKSATFVGPAWQPLPNLVLFSCYHCGEASSLST